MDLIFYSLAGYGLEKLYAFAVRARHQVRKCFLLLPLCPVYGLAMVAVLRLAGDTESFWQLALYGGILCTAVEYAVHFLYEKCLGVLFWDYSGTHLDLHRRICFPLPWPGDCSRPWRCGWCSRVLPRCWRVSLRRRP
ncbi:MAG: putative ABC transporter permease [Oscillospiraceae bacterium]